MTERLVKVPGFDGDLEVLDDEVFLMRRRLVRTRATIDTDAYGRGWFYGEMRCVTGRASFTHGGRQVWAPAEFQLLIRDFGIVQWRLAPGEYELTFFLSRRPLPAHLCRQFSRPAQIFHAPRGPAFPRLRQDVETMLASATDHTAIDMLSAKPARAPEIKDVIERMFQQDIRLEDVAATLGLAPAVVSRQFKACYALTPKDYLNQVRASDSLWSLFVGEDSATTIGYQAGFNDYKQYYHHLRKYAHAAPSRLRPPFR